MAKNSFDKGVKADGKGMMDIKATTPGDSVQGEVAGSAPGGESKKGKHIEMEGPNAYKMSNPK